MVKEKKVMKASKYSYTERKVIITIHSTVRKTIHLGINRQDPIEKMTVILTIFVLIGGV